MVEILDSIDITLSHIKPTFAVHTYILLAQIKLTQNQVEVVELVNKCIRQIDASIDLYNSKKEINNRNEILDTEKMKNEVNDVKIEDVNTFAKTKYLSENITVLGNINN